MITALACLLALWALGGLWTLRGIEVRLESAAAALLAQHRSLSGVKVGFRGPTAVLSGAVSSADALVLAERLIREELRVDGANPVLAFHSRVTVETPEGSVRGDRYVGLPDHRRAKQSWAVFAVANGRAKLSGVVRDVETSVALKREVDRFWTDFTVTNALRVDAGQQPMERLTETLRDLPKPAPELKEIMASTIGDGVWMRLPPNADELILAQALFGIEVNPAEVSQSLDGWRLLHEGGGKPEVDESLAVTEVRATGLPSLGGIARARAVGPPYVGWAADGDEVWLFGAVASEEIKAQVMEQADKLFRNRTVHVQALVTDPSRLDDPRNRITLPSRATGVKLGFLVPGRSMVSYPVDVNESRLLADFPEATMNEAQLREALIPFRERLAESGKIKLAEPYLSVVTDGRVVLVCGETASAEMRAAMVEALSLMSSSLTLVHDELRVTPLVTPAPEMLLALQQAARLEPGKRLAMTLRPRQVARRGVVLSLPGSADLISADEMARASRAMKKVLDVDNEALFELIGHTDGSGDVHVDAAATLKQAEEVRAKLVQSGFDPLRLAVRGAGSSEPISENVTERGRALNRRVDIRWLVLNSEPKDMK
jgi:hypothetical protein